MSDPRLAARTEHWRPSKTLAVMAEAARRRAAGEDIIDFGPGEPDFATPEPIRAAARRALDEGFTHYTPTPGIPELREAIAGRYRQRTGASYGADQVVAGCGGKQLLWEVFHALFEEGDEVLLPVPYWTSFPEQILMAGAAPMAVDAGPETAYVPDPEALEKACSPRTRGIVVNSPSNPTGAVWDREVLEAIAELALERGLWIIADETYDRFLYDGAVHTSLAEREDLAGQLVVINSFSKTYAMTGWRIGYALGPEPLMQAVQRLQSQLTSGPNSIAQKAALAALEDPEGRVEAAVQEMLEAFERRRGLMIAGLGRVEGFRCPEPRGAFYAFPDVRQACESGKIEGDEALARHLLETAGLAVVPGSAFGKPGCLRFSFALGEEDLERGLERLAQVL